MSKSKGNLVLVSKLRAEGRDPMAIRLALLAHHYRSDWEWFGGEIDDQYADDDEMGDEDEEDEEDVEMDFGEESDDTEASDVDVDVEIEEGLDEDDEDDGEEDDSSSDESENHDDEEDEEDDVGVNKKRGKEFDLPGHV